MEAMGQGLRDSTYKSYEITSVLCLFHCCFILRTATCSSNVFWNRTESLNEENFTAKLYRTAGTQKKGLL